jgi:hypothetical protein
MRVLVPEILIFKDPRKTTNQRFMSFGTLADKKEISVSVRVSFEKKERVCSLSLSHSLFFKLPRLDSNKRPSD